MSGGALNSAPIPTPVVVCEAVCCKEVRDLFCKESNVVALQRAEIRMVRWMCGIKLKDRFTTGPGLKFRISYVSMSCYLSRIGINT